MKYTAAPLSKNCFRGFAATFSNFIQLLTADVAQRLPEQVFCLYPEGGGDAIERVQLEIGTTAALDVVLRLGFAAQASFAASICDRRMRRRRRIPPDADLVLS